MWHTQNVYVSTHTHKHTHECTDTHKYVQHMQVSKLVLDITV